MGAHIAVFRVVAGGVARSIPFVTPEGLKTAFRQPAHLRPACNAMLRLAVLFHRLGPYHIARLGVLGQKVKLRVIEFTGVDPFYAWRPVAHGGSFERTTLFPNSDVTKCPKGEVARAIAVALEDFRPDVVALNGWSDRRALAALAWCVRHRVPAVMMSDSTAADARRAAATEFLKQRLIRLCSSGLVAGSRHTDYIVTLGMPRERTFTGFDIVDNEYFRLGAAVARQARAKVRERLSLPAHYFLTSCRFVAQKNLSGLLQSYARYQKLRGDDAWHLVILGDGPLLGQLQHEVHALGLAARVHMPGFVQYDELPDYYGLAHVFLLASTVEPWGLVVNEAMAAGLPVLVSKHCGCTPDLIKDGISGFTFDPYDTDGLARLMVQMGSESCDRAGMGRASQTIINRWTPETFAQGMLKAAEAAMTSPPLTAGLIDRALLWVLARR